VDFEALAIAASPAKHTQLIPQGTLLQHLGIEARTEALARSLDGPARENHLAAFRRLTDRGEMGTLFKVLALHPPTTAPPPGTEP
jgi:SAM-dependent MidA family methyltransferase